MKTRLPRKAGFAFLEASYVQYNRFVQWLEAEKQSQLLHLLSGGRRYRALWRYRRLFLGGEP